MFSSVRTGLEAILRQAPQVAGILVHPVDVPLVRPLTVRAVLKAAQAQDEAVLVPVFAGREGHPVFLTGPAVTVFAGTVDTEQLRTPQA